MNLVTPCTSALLTFLSSGLRVIYLIDRDLNNTQRKNEKIITTNVDEFKSALDKLSANLSGDKRVYCSLNERDFNKARRLFDLKKLESDHASPEQSFNFYKNCFNHWVSCLSKPESRATKYWLIDFDSKEFTDVTMIRYINYLFQSDIEVFYKYETKNGFHLIVKPFKTSIFKADFVEIKKDALALLAYVI